MPKTYVTFPWKTIFQLMVVFLLISAKSNSLYFMGPVESYHINTEDSFYQIYCRCCAIRSHFRLLETIENMGIVAVYCTIEGILVKEKVGK